MTTDAAPLAEPDKQAWAIVDALLPQDAPAKGETCFLSISCGEESMHWAWHQGENYEPKVVWK